MIAHINGAYADIYAWDNLYAAYRMAAKGKRGSRPDIYRRGLLPARNRPTAGLEQTRGLPKSSPDGPEVI